VNCEIATLRAILKYFGLWTSIANRVSFLREQTDAGKALSLEEESRLLAEIARSPSPSLFTFFVMSLDAGLRPSEIRSLRRRDLRLRWQNREIAEGEIVVGRSKTEAGTGRVVPLTGRARAALTLWWGRFPDAGPDAFLFPYHHVGVAHGSKPKSWLWGVDTSRPMTRASYKCAFDTARTNAKVDCRFYDARHTFVTRLAENPAVSVETIRQLAGHVSERMLSRYAHIRAQARRDAIATLEKAQLPADRAQEWAQCEIAALEDGKPPLQN
jgi:integrase